MNSIVKSVAWLSKILAIPLVVFLSINPFDCWGGAPVHRNTCTDNHFIKYVYDNNVAKVKATYNSRNSSTAKNARSCRHGNAVDIAAKNANEVLFFYFINKGAKIGFWPRGDSFLNAYKGNNENILNYLYEKELSTPVKQELAIKAAIEYGDLERVQALLEKGVDIHSDIFKKGSVLVEPVMNDDLRMTQYLIQLGFDVNKRGDVRKLAKSSHRPIDLAVRTESIRMAELLIANGASVNPPFQTYSPLMNAVCFNNTEMARFLVKNGADVNAKSRWGRTPLELAISYSNLPEKHAYHISQVRLKEFEEILNP